MLAGDRVVLVTEPGAPSAVIDGVEKAAGYAGATVTGTVALQPKFNDLSGATRSSLSAINTALATTDGTVLAPAADQQTAYQQEAAQLIATAILNQADGEAGLTAAQAQTLLGAYAKGGYLTASGTPWNRATLAVIVTPQTAPADGPNDPANQVLLAVAAQFASASAATLVAGPAASSASSASAISVLRGSSVSSQVSSVDNADTRLGQISVDLGPRRPAGRREAEQLRYLGCFRGQPGTVACAERDADGPRHADTEGDGKGQEDREHEVKGAARPGLPVLAGPR